MALSDYKYSILILIFGFVYFQFFMSHHSNEHYKLQVSSDTVLLHANWTKNIENLCCLGKVHDALALKNIKNLDLSFSMSSFNDEDVMKILNLNNEKFNSYENIKLDLSGLKLTNNVILNIFKSIRNGVKSLQVHLNGIQTTQGFGQSLANQLNGLKSLEQLKLSLIMSIKQNQVDSFINHHNPTQSLKSLDLILIGNQITKSGLGHVKQYFSKINVYSLSFNLYANKIGVQGAELLTEALKQVNQLKQLNLDLYFNNITEVGTQKISEVIQNMTKLTTLTLNLDFNYIKNQGAKALGKTLSQMTQLENLYLGVASKNFGYLGFKYIINGIQKLTQLKRLSLRCGVNRVGYNGAEITKQMLQKLTNLQHLQLGFLQNYIGDDGITLLAEQVAKMNTLKSIYLNFAFNDAKSFGLIKVIKSFLNSKLQNLHLGLSSNQFRDSQIKLIESHLTTLIKNNNNFILDFTDTAVSKKQAARLQKIFKQANSNFNKNSKISVNSIIPEQEQAKPTVQTKKQPKVEKKVQAKVTQKKVDNNTQSIEL